MIDKTLIQELENLLKLDLDRTLFPYQKGNAIRIGHIVVRHSRDEYKIFDTTTNKMIAKTFSKTSAVALARTLALGKNYTRDIILLDTQIKKYYLDCIFYKNTIQKTKDNVKKHIFKTRYEDAMSRTQFARDRLDKYIFG